MSDRMPAQITIGGTIKRSLVEELCGQITESGAGPEWDGGVKVRDEAELRRLIGKDGTITLYDCEARYGEFETLEAFLREHEIPFDRHCDAKYEYDGMLVKYRPATGLHEYLATQDGEQTINGVEIDEVASQLDGIEQMPHEQLLAVAAQVRDELRSLVGTDVPDVPPLVIVED